MSLTPTPALESHAKTARARELLFSGIYKRLTVFLNYNRFVNVYFLCLFKKLKILKIDLIIHAWKWKIVVVDFKYKI